MQKRTYADHAATTPLMLEVLEAMSLWYNLGHIRNMEVDHAD